MVVLWPTNLLLLLHRLQARSQPQLPHATLKTSSMPASMEEVAVDPERGATRSAGVIRGKVADERADADASNSRAHHRQRVFQPRLRLPPLRLRPLATFTTMILT